MARTQAEHIRAFEVGDPTGSSRHENVKPGRQLQLKPSARVRQGGCGKGTVLDQVDGDHDRRGQVGASCANDAGHALPQGRIGELLSLADRGEPAGGAGQLPYVSADGVVQPGLAVVHRHTELAGGGVLIERLVPVGHSCEKGHAVVRQPEFEGEQVVSVPGAVAVGVQPPTEDDGFAALQTRGLEGDHAGVGMWRCRRTDAQRRSPGLQESTQQTSEHNQAKAGNAVSPAGNESV